MKYQVDFSGFVYVEADSKEEAYEKAANEDEIIYSEQGFDSIVEVDDFAVEI